jgi:hypothetical protein
VAVDQHCNHCWAPRGGGVEEPLGRYGKKGGRPVYCYGRRILKYLCVCVFASRQPLPVRLLSNL